MADLKISALTAASTPLAGTEVLPIVQSSTTKKVSIANITAGRDVTSKTETAAPRAGADPTNNSIVTGLSIFNGQANVSGDGVQLLFDHSFGTPLSQNRGAYVKSTSTSGYSGAVDLIVGNSQVSTFYDGYKFGADGKLTLLRDNLVIGVSGKGIDFSATPGTGTSELFNDYEEGTWTPSVGGSATYTGSNSGRYTRIGRKVFIEGILEINVLGSGSVLDISGLPFTSNATNPGGAVTVAYWAGMSSSLVYLAGAIANNSSVISMRYATAAATGLSFAGVFANGSRVDFTGSYTV